MGTDQERRRIKLARRSSKRKMTIELVERNELLNLRLISEAVAHSMKQRGGTKRDEQI